MTDQLQYMYMYTVQYMYYMYMYNHASILGTNPFTMLLVYIYCIVLC